LHHPDNAANYLTISATGRIAKQPELKFCAVSVEKCAPHSETPLPQLLLVPDSAQTRPGASTPVATESI
jgi:predicted molibdopterin-dependent oxidoreductase YjgC